MLASASFAQFAPVLRDALLEHAEDCARCRWRWERTLQLARQRTRQSVDDDEANDQPGICYAGMLSPLGTLWVASTPVGLCRASFDENEVDFCDGVERAGHGIPRYSSTTMRPIMDALGAYFAGHRCSVALPMDFGKRTPFQRDVLEAVRGIPYGETRSYSEIAAAVGRPSAMRAVGTVMATNSLTMAIPCHRVVRGDGSSGNYATVSLGGCGPVYKEMLLAMERAEAAAWALRDDKRSTNNLA